MQFAFQRHLYSSAGEAGLEDLSKRLEIWIGPLGDAWRSRNGTNGLSHFFDVLTDVIAAVDRPDLRTPEVRLRPTTDGDIPSGVICKLARALIEALTSHEKSAAIETIEGLAGEARLRGRVDFEQGFGAALAELLIEEGELDRAIDVINANLFVRSSSPYSQYLLYQALRKQKQSGFVAESSRVCLDDLSDRFCEQPFITLLTLSGRDKKPDTFACNCAAMLPYPLDAFSQDGDDKNENLWNGPAVQEIRRSILDGEFAYCGPLICPYLINGSLPKREEVTDPVMREIIDNNWTHISSAPRRISLGHDDSCNIACPSCRSEIITAKNDARDVMDRFVDRNILPLMQDAVVELYVSGDGDPIGSKHYRRLLHNLDPIRHSRVSLYLQSNGLLITPKEWESLSHVQPLIKGMIVSIDAAERETYEDVRRPGKWDTLVGNMGFIADLRRNGVISFLCINFVVQKKNFEQMPAFVDLGLNWSVDRILFSKMFYTPRAGMRDYIEYRANAVTDNDHPDHQRLLEVLRHPILRSKQVDLFNIGASLSPSSDPAAPTSGAEVLPNVAVAASELEPRKEIIFDLESWHDTIETPISPPLIERLPTKPSFWRSLFRNWGQDV